MGISVEGEKCPVCGSYIFDNDDLVFCPECGAPHHRDCYAAIGHCAYADKHGTDQEYKRIGNVGKKAEEDKNDDKEPRYSGEPRTEAEITCRSCGEKVPYGSKHCPNCGTPVIAQAYTTFGTPIIMDPLGGVSPEENIDDVPVREVKEFVAINTPRYLPRFKRLNEKGKSSWNWAAFLFPHAWFFYRKMYLPGILFFILSALSSALSSAYYLLVNTFPNEAVATTNDMLMYMLEHFDTLNKLPIYISAAGLVIGIIIRIIAGFTGDRIYRSNVLEGIRKVKKEGAEYNVPLTVELRKKGGVNISLGMVGLFALQWIVSMIYVFI